MLSGNGAFMVASPAIQDVKEKGAGRASPRRGDVVPVRLVTGWNGGQRTDSV
jgi:hypothetical protein